MRLVGAHISYLTSHFLEGFPFFLQVVAEKLQGGVEGAVDRAGGTAIGMGYLTAG